MHFVTHVSSGALSLKACRSGPIRTAKVVAVAQAKLTFIKPTQTGIYNNPKDSCLKFISHRYTMYPIFTWFSKSIFLHFINEMIPKKIIMRTMHYID